MPTPVTRSAPTPTSSSSARTMPPASDTPSRAEWSVSSRSLGLGEHRVGEVGDRHADVGVPEVDPDGHPRGPAQRQRLAAAAVAEPAVFTELAGDGRHGAGERPLARARSACEVGPRERSSSRIRSRLRRDLTVVWPLNELWEQGALDVQCAKIPPFSGV